MPPAAKYDYAALRTQFISASPAISVNELCRRNGIALTSASAIHTRAKNEGWVEQRSKAMTKADTRVIDAISEREAKRRLRRLEVEDNAIEAIDEAITKMRADMQRMKKVRDPETGEYHEEPVVTLRADQVVQLMDRIKGMFGDLPAAEAGDPSLAASFNFNFDGDSPEHRALATQLVAATRGAGGPARGTAGSSPLPTAPGAGADE